MMTILGLCLIIAVMLTPCAALADEWTKSLPQLEKSLTAAETTLSKIDVTQLTVVYREGRWIEGARTRALGYIEMLRAALSLPGRRNNRIARV